MTQRSSNGHQARAVPWASTLWQDCRPLPPLQAHRQQQEAASSDRAMPTARTSPGFSGHPESHAFPLPPRLSPLQFPAPGTPFPSPLPPQSIAHFYPSWRAGCYPGKSLKTPHPYKMRLLLLSVWGGMSHLSSDHVTAAIPHLVTTVSLG